MKLTIITLLALIALAMTDDVQSDIYTGLSYQKLGESDLVAVGGIIGYQVNNRLWVDYRLSKGLGVSRIDGVKTNLDSYEGAYITTTIGQGSSIVPYVLVGYSDISIDRDEVESDSGFSWGGGIAFHLGDSLSVNLEYVKITSDVSATNINFINSF